MTILFKALNEYNHNLVPSSGQKAPQKGLNISPKSNTINVVILDTKYSAKKNERFSRCEQEIKQSQLLVENNQRKWRMSS